MLTETEARELLQRAAATIEVRPGAPIDATASRTRRWAVPLVTAAAVVLALVIGFAIADRNDGASPSPAPPVPHVTAVPSVFAFDADSAERMLSGLGLRVTRETIRTCEYAGGRAVRTSPEAGAPISRGQAVRLFVTETASGADCPVADTLAWKVLDFANGRGPSPAFASRVVAYVNGQRTTLTGTEAADVRTWKQGTALAALTALTRQVSQYRDAEPYLAITTGTRSSTCGTSQGIPAELRGRRSYLMEIALPTAGADHTCHSANVYTERNGSIDAIVVRVSDGAPQRAEGHEVLPSAARIAAKFLAFARSERDRVPLGAQVKLFVGGELYNVIDHPEIRRNWTYSPCSGVRCDVHVLPFDKTRSANMRTVDAMPSCIQSEQGLTPAAAGAVNSVVLTEPGPEACFAASGVQLWFDDAGRIVAINLLTGQR